MRSHPRGEINREGQFVREVSFANVDPHLQATLREGAAMPPQENPEQRAAAELARMQATLPHGWVEYGCGACGQRIFARRGMPQACGTCSMARNRIVMMLTTEEAAAQAIVPKYTI